MTNLSQACNHTRKPRIPQTHTNPHFACAHAQQAGLAGPAQQPLLRAACSPGLGWPGCGAGLLRACAQGHIHFLCYSFGMKH